ncbi:D-alanine--D-alanine ligase [candidate division KSB3 bacterium]|uniref:D-alanine--D-alanine ligase n=1 Tax=candidate division KSB3 bacterium TaxID=2044937 RepID=A0A9D5Q6M9_9BACT|nr:D-alanine--D-alanine ligase [candidate division KSB3 bacterium]MBD3326024.1 D-alanine--D-alanine ligase [candidate division KSB3 bacterium]
MTVAILHAEMTEDARKDEQDTLVQVEAVSQALRELGHDPVAVAFSLNIPETMQYLQALQPEIVFNLVEAVAAQGRLIHVAPAILDVLSLPYTGAQTEAMFLTSNKLLTKRLLHASGFATPPWVSTATLREEPSITAGRYIVKSVWEDASIGLSEEAVIEANSAAELRRMLAMKREQCGGENFAEAFVEGREFNLALLAGAHGPEVLPPAEIYFDAYPDGKLRIVDYRAKWEEDSFEYQHTPRRFVFCETDAALLDRLKILAEACWRLFDLRGYARVDFRVDQAEVPWILEVNANPCLSPDAGFMAAAAQAGLSMNQVVERILYDTDALEERGSCTRWL